jgi:Ca2+-binding EF-hand superfamily protein
MKKQFPFGSVIRWFGTCAFVSCVLANAAVVRAQETKAFSVGMAVSSGGTNFVFQTGGGMGAGEFFINGSDIGTILLKACDLDQDSKVTLGELKTFAAATFKLWDSNTDGSVSSNELSVAVKELFPTPPPGAGARAMRVVGGVASEVPAGEIVTPDMAVVRHLLNGADTNKDGLLSLQEVNDFLEKTFVRWDQNGDGSLDAPELNGAFGQLSFPDGIATAPAP